MDRRSSGHSSSGSSRPFLIRMARRLVLSALLAAMLVLAAPRAVASEVPNGDLAPPGYVEEQLDWLRVVYPPSLRPLLRPGLEALMRWVAEGPALLGSEARVPTTMLVVPDASELAAIGLSDVSRSTTLAVLVRPDDGAADPVRLERSLLSPLVEEAIERASGHRPLPNWLAIGVTEVVLRRVDGSSEAAWELLVGGAEV